MLQDPARLPICEEFVSIQGEGSLVGIPSYFIRTSGCNLRCGWCDTPFASWEPEGSSLEIADVVARVTQSGLKHAVLTGGEPMLFPAIATLTNALRSRGIHVTIETAGTVFRVTGCDLLSLSPKLANSTPINDPRDPTGIWAKRHESRRLQPDVLQSLLDIHPQRQLKFVVTSEADVAEIEVLVLSLSGLKPEHIMLMPEGTVVPSEDLKSWVVKTCLSRGWRYCTRLHLDLFGHRRGT